MLGEGVEPPVPDPVKQRAEAERRRDEPDDQDELAVPRGGRPHLGPQPRRERLVVAEDRIDRQPQQDGREQVEHPRENAREHADDERAPFRAAVFGEEPPHRVLRVRPLVLERVVSVVQRRIRHCR